MNVLADEPISVGLEVCASSANLGPGFDAVGLGLDLVDRVELRSSDHTSIEVRGQGAGQVPLDDSHLVLRCVREGLAALGHPDPSTPFALRCVNAVPHARGLGSSAAARAAGFGLAALVCGVEPREFAFTMSAAAEGHADNAAAAVFGGAQLTWNEQPGAAVPRFGRLNLPVHRSLRCTVWVPDEELRTDTARAVLPQELALTSVVQQISRAALLPIALASGEHLLQATMDWVHQPVRAPLLPASDALMRTLRSQSVAAMISGAGPSVLSLHLPEQDEVVANEAGRVCGFSVRHLGLGAGLRPVEVGR